MNKYYENPIVEVLEFIQADVIRTSNGDDWSEDDFVPAQFG